MDLLEECNVRLCSSFATPRTLFRQSESNSGRKEIHLRHDGAATTLPAIYGALLGNCRTYWSERLISFMM